MKEIRIIIWSIIAISLSILLVCLLINNDRDGFRFSEELVEVYKDTIPSENIENLNINWRSGDINIYKSDTDEIKLIQKSSQNLKDNQKIQVTTSNDTLFIKEGKTKFHFFYIGFGNIGTILDVYLPEKVYDNFTLNCQSGDVYISDISLDKAIIELTSGEIDIDNMIAEAVRVAVTSGEINIHNIDTNAIDLKATSGSIRTLGNMKSINLNTTSGNIVLENKILPDSMNVSVTSGKINILLPENDGFNVDYKITSGEFDSDFDLYSNIAKSKNGNGKYKDGGSTFFFKVISGEINLIKK